VAEADEAPVADEVADVDDTDVDDEDVDDEDVAEDDVDAVADQDEDA
jgi:hypothetical protein